LRSYCWAICRRASARSGRIQDLPTKRAISAVLDGLMAILTPCAMILNSRQLAAVVVATVVAPPDLTSTITDEVIEEVTQWQQPPLKAMCPIVYFDALRLKTRDEGKDARELVNPPDSVHGAK
jgi:hypothetical protein